MPQGDLQSRIQEISQSLVNPGETPRNPEPEREEPVLDGESVSALDTGAADAGQPEGEAIAGESQQDEEIRSVADLARLLEVEPEYIYGLEFTLGEMGPDGKPVSLKLGELKDKLQEYERDRSTVGQERENFAKERQQFLQQAQEVLAGGQRLNQQLIDARARVQAVVAQRDSIDWNEFEKVDPGRAALERQKYDRLLNEAGQNFYQTQQQIAQQATVFQHNYRAEQDRLLVERLPAWRDREVALREANEIGEWAAKTYGYSPNDLVAAVDWQHRDILRKACKYDQLMAKMPETQKQVQQAKQTLRPGAGLPRSTISTQKLTALKQRAISSGKKEDQVAAGVAILAAAARKQR